MTAHPIPHPQRGNKAGGGECCCLPGEPLQAVYATALQAPLVFLTLCLEKTKLTTTFNAAVPKIAPTPDESEVLPTDLQVCLLPREDTTISVALVEQRRMIPAKSFWPSDQ